MHRLLLLAAVILLSAACAGREATPPSAGGAAVPQLATLPAPGALAALAPQATRQASGSHAALNRTLVSDGAQYVPWGGVWSANAEVSGDAALIHGNAGALNYVFYQVATPLVDHNDKIIQLQVDYSWSGAEPAAPDGLYIGLPDHASDRWVWLDAATARSDWLDVAARNIHGIDPAVNPNGSMLAVVNYSGSDVTIERIALRFEAPGDMQGDEWIYYMSRVEGDPLFYTSISRARLTGGVPEVIHATDLATVTYQIPFVVHYLGDWKLVYSRKAAGSPAEIWMSDLDGAAPWVIASGPNDYYPMGWDYGTNRGLYVEVNGAVNELHGFDYFVENGRISRAADFIGKAVWDISVDTATTGYGAITQFEVDSFDHLFHIASFRGNSPFPINATPTMLFTRLPAESSGDPEIVELASFAGVPDYWVYFSSHNRDDATYNIYRVPAQGIVGDPEPVLVDAAYNLRFPTPSRDGRYLAYTRYAPSAGLQEIVVADLLHPEAPGQVVATNAVAQLSWYDPTP